MARIRTIKPEFFLDHDLDQLSEAHQKLFVGLWCLADREGRLRDECHRIKAQLFPFRDYDVDAMLDTLHNAQFIVRYESAGHACIAIPKFEEHQRCHPREVATGFPSPPDLFESRGINRPAITVGLARRVEFHASTLVEHVEGKGREGKEITESTPAARLFCLWHDLAQKNGNTKLTSPLRAKINAALKTWSEEQIGLAIRGFVADPWRKDKPTAQGLQYLFRDVNRFIEATAQPERPKTIQFKAGMDLYSLGERNENVG